jgi:integrase
MGSLIKTKGGIYYGVFCHRGKRVWRTMGTRDPEEARRVFEVTAKEFVTWDRLTLVGFQKEILEMVEGKIGGRTHLLYTHSVREFIRIVGNRPLKSVNPYHIERFMARRLKEVSAVRVNIEFRSLKALFTRAVLFKMIDENPMEGLKQVRIPQRCPVFLSAAEFQKLIAAIDDPQFRSIVILAVCTAMRVGELASLRWENVDLERGVVHLINRDDFRLKSLRPRDIPINERVRAVLQALPRTSEFLFTGKYGNPFKPHTISHRFKRYARRAGLPQEVHFHTLRHTGASWLIQSNVPVSYVREILGHSSIMTTMLYSHSTADHLRESLLRLDSILGN